MPKIRDSGMPEEGMWETFFDPTRILSQLGLSVEAETVVDMGCGYGTFAIPAAQMISGKVYAVDIEPDMLAACREKAAVLGLKNLHTIHRDFIEDGTGLDDDSINYCMLFNILHTARPEVLLHEARRILRPQGMVSIIHWNYDPTTPRGPAMDMRPKPDQIQTWLKAAGFSLEISLIDLPPYHYGIVAIR